MFRPYISHLDVFLPIIWHHANLGQIGVFVRVSRKQTISRSFLDKMNSRERRND